ncbi:quinone-dependent dihydroorotate dehydrogenase [Actinospica sp. MGRD01-02]|uniref:Dihydroorotate dehydrogenase (quinone) n=1 Tax=Actinospica acidithermotolerans TaxID=2828514 RepID=A0A941IM08_9ACTN|nr:quinone-dependent dihydroorotate dehydrogenase [Actinospica acidithermotolerans]MBR7830562.1 quinone-dependent dihydroorotate dehydrogenase [Actinospica acidithermotolerans]
MFYRLLFRSVFQGMDPERAHHLGFGAIRAAAGVPGGSAALRSVFAAEDPGLRVKALGLEFPGPFGLAAGFDKNAVGIDALAALGFSFVEVGTVTGRPQPGNPAPRMFRLVRDRCLINRMGFNNDGADAVAARLARRAAALERNPGKFPPVILGVNIGKTKVVPEDEAVADYVYSAAKLAPYADYLTVNVSSPNTPGLRNLQAVEVLRPLLLAVREAADAAADRRVPLLVKIAPDLANEDVDAVADLAVEIGLDGIIATNTTVARHGLLTPESEVAAYGAGGLSGPVLRPRAIDVLTRLRGRVGPGMTIIGVGGITTAADAQEFLDAGATLLQGFTGFIYEGPLWARRVQHGLRLKELQK